VVTLIKDPHAITWGTVYCIPDEEAATILKNLDYREKGGYIRTEVDIFISGRESPVVKSILYLASEKNSNFLGESPVEEVAYQIYKSVGPSGPNVDYLLNLADSMRKMNALDSHITALEEQVIELVKAGPLPHHTHPTLISLCSIDTSTTNSDTTTTTTTIVNSMSATDTTETTTTITSTTTTVNSVSTEKTDLQRKYFLSPSASVKGVICIDDGAVMAVSQRGRSLLAAGIASIVGQFEPNELVSIVNSMGGEIARGITTYGSEEILKIKGLHSTKILPVLGFTRGETVVNHHNMILV
jgi:predicted ribosome-associated RNA-binding protein Tma20